LPEKYRHNYLSNIEATNEYLSGESTFALYRELRFDLLHPGFALGLLVPSAIETTSEAYIEY
jgi:hypothetical protein